MESVKTARFEELWHAWPRSGQKDLAKSLQGQVGNLVERRTDDTPIRLSSAFNRTGHALPTSTIWSGIEVTDKDGFKYIVDVNDMRSFLQSKFGKPKHLGHGQTDAVGKRGILLFEGVSSLKDVPGHFDLWDGTQTAEVKGDYWTECKDVWLWPISD